MYIYELKYPGSFVSSAYGGTAFTILKRIRDLESSFVEMAVALNLFETERDRLTSEAHQRLVAVDSTLLDEKWEAERLINIELGKKYEDQFISEGKDVYLPDQRAAISDLVYAEIRLMKRNSGVLPSSYQHKIQFIYAKAFISSMDTFGKLLKSFSDEFKSDAPGILTQKNNFKSSFSQLMNVRHSLQHPEHRNRGLDRDGNPLVMQPGEKGGVVTVSGESLVLNQLTGNKFGTTISDGQFIEIEISDQTMIAVQKVMQGVIDALQWEGVSDIRPSY